MAKVSTAFLAPLFHFFLAYFNLFMYDEKNITEHLTIIKGASIKEDNPEVIKARKLKLEIFQ